MDHALDLVIEPDGKWYWKDEDDFAEAQHLGVLTPQEAAAVRHEGERVIAGQLWLTGWEHWRPWGSTQAAQHAESRNTGEYGRRPS
jgi:hypothetical protein